MRDSLRHFVAEFVGTFALVFVGGGAIMAAELTKNPAGITQVALAHGLILALMVTATMRVSGHLNPAVTLGFVVTRRIEPVMAFVYIIAQVLAAVIAAYALRGLFPDAVVASSRLGGQSISIDVTMLQAVVLEFIATFFLVFVVFGTAVDPRAPKVGGFAIGLTVAADILAIVGELHAVPFELGIPRVYTVLKLDERRDKEQTLEDKVASVERLLKDGG